MFCSPAAYRTNPKHEYTLQDRDKLCMSNPCISLHTSSYQLCTVNCNVKVHLQQVIAEMAGIC